MTEEKSIQILEFKGKKEHWPAWSLNFLMKAKIKGYKEVLEGKKTVPKSSSTVLSNEEEEVAKLNEVGYADLVLSINAESPAGKVAFQIVKNCMSSEYPNGNCADAWRRLCKKYEPDSVPSMLRLKKQFNMSKLSNGGDPDEWITFLEDIKGRLEDMNSPISESDFLIHVLNNLTEEYDIEVSLLEKRLGNKDEPLTIDEVRADLSLRYEKINKKDDKDEEVHKESGNGDKALGTYEKKFKGRCNYCGIHGHKLINCKSRKKEEVGTQNKHKTHENFKENKSFTRFNGKCNNCGKVGHKEAECWSKKKTSSDSAEVALMASDDYFLAANELSVDKCIWIGDTGASCHFTNEEEGLYDVEEIKDEIQIGKGSMIATKKGKLKVNIKQPNGTTVCGVMSPVKYCKDLKFKLFSISMSMDKGFKLGNNGRKIFVEKPGVRVSFDRIFETSSGYVAGAELSIVKDIAGFETSMTSS